LQTTRFGCPFFQRSIGVHPLACLEAGRQGKKGWFELAYSFKFFILWDIVTKLLLLVTIWVNGILTMIIEVYVLGGQNGSACDLFSTVTPKKVNLNF
jgi:hypothetical protein